MAEISRVALFGKLSPLAYQAMESATVFCKLRGNPYVELEHWLFQILNLPDSDMHHIVRHFGLDGAKLAADFTTALDRLPRGATAISDFGSIIEETIQAAWIYASLKYGETRIRSGHVLLALFKTSPRTQRLLGISKQFALIKEGVLSDDFDSIVKGSPETTQTASDGSGAVPGQASDAIAPAATHR